MKGTSSEPSDTRGVTLIPRQIYFTRQSQVFYQILLMHILLCYVNNLSYFSSPCPEKESNVTQTSTRCRLSLFCTDFKDTVFQRLKTTTVARQNESFLRGKRDNSTSTKKFSNYVLLPSKYS